MYQYFINQWHEYGTDKIRSPISSFEWKFSLNSNHSVSFGRCLNVSTSFTKSLYSILICSFLLYYNEINK